MPEHGTPEVSSHLPDLESAPILSNEPASSPGSARGLAATFRSLRHRNYRLYFFGQLISLVGTWMQTTAMMWLAFELTQASTWPALVGTAGILPTFLFGAFGGALAERVPKRSLIFATQSAFLVLALLLAVLGYAGIVTAWQLLLVSAVTGLVQAIDLPARLTFVMDMAGREDLPNAVALNSLLFNVARALGPAASGLLLRWFTPADCFLANAISYVAVLWALARMDITGSSHVVDTGKGIRALWEGFGYLARRRELAFLVLLAGTTALCGWPSQILLPALAQDELGEGKVAYSLMVSGTGFGALAAALAVATFGSAKQRPRMIGIGVGVVSAALVALALAKSLILAISCCALIGFGLILFLSTSQSVIQLSAGDHNRGRIMGIWAMTLSGAAPLGNLLAGKAADYWRAPPVLLFSGLTCAFAALVLLVRFRPWGQSAADPPEPLTS